MTNNIPTFFQWACHFLGRNPITNYAAGPEHRRRIVARFQSALFPALLYLSVFFVYFTFRLHWAVWQALPVALFASGFVLFIDRQILLATSRISRWARIVLTLLMSVIFSLLLDPLIFHSEVQEELNSMEREEHQRILSDTLSSSSLVELRAERDRARTNLDRAEAAYTSEIDGRGGSGLRGYGPSAQARGQIRSEAQNQLNSIESRLSTQQSRLETEREERLGALGEVYATPGVMRDVRAVWRAATRSVESFIFFFALTLLFFIIEAMVLWSTDHLSWPNDPDRMEQERINERMLREQELYLGRDPRLNQQERVRALLARNN